jgi:hypothetical protein
MSRDLTSDIFVENREGMLLFYIEAEFTEPMDESVLVNFLKMAVTMIYVNGKACFPDEITELVDGGLGHIFALLCVFRGDLYSVGATFSGWPPAQR